MARDQPTRIPLIKLWRLLLVPLQGEIDDTATDRLSTEVLETIHAREVDGLVLDVTGLWLMDSHLCAVLSRIAQAAALMGTRTIICGMSPETAMTLQAMGLELGILETVLSLEQALERHGVRAPVGTDDEENADDELDADMLDMALSQVEGNPSRSPN